VEIVRDILFAVNVIVFRVKLLPAICTDGRTDATSFHGVVKFTSKDHNMIIDFALYPNYLFVVTGLLLAVIQRVTKHHLHLFASQRTNYVRT